MDIHHLKTFIIVAQEGSITRAALRRNLSQPAVSAHIKDLEETLRLTLFTRTAKGMRTTAHGQKLLPLANEVLAAQQAFSTAAAQLQGGVQGAARIGAGGRSSASIMAKMLAQLSKRHPHIEISLHHGVSDDLLQNLQDGELDAVFYNEAGEPNPDWLTVQVGGFSAHLAAPSHYKSNSNEPDWRRLAKEPWLTPSSGVCCGKIIEALFERFNFRPERIVSIDHESLTRKLIAQGVGVGLLHDDTAFEAEAAGEATLLYKCPQPAKVLFAMNAAQAHTPAQKALLEALQAALETP